MADEQAPLGTDDYRQLLGMLTSADQSTQVQGQAIAKKLNPSEQQSFFDYQKQANAGKGEATRTDNSVLGLPPEAVAVGAAGALGPAADVAAGLTERVTGIMKGAIGTAAPYVKYQAARGIMRSMGVPELVAEPIAWGIAGYRNGKPAPAVTEATPTVAAEPKININAVDFKRIKDLMSKGVAQGDAVRTIMNLRAKAGL